RLADLRGDAAFSTWNHRITVTVVANAMRKVRRLRERETDLNDLDSLHPVNSEARRIDPDLRERLAKAIDALPEIYRTTLIMHDLEGYTHTEIASVLGVAEGTCKSRLSAAVSAASRCRLADTNRSQSGRLPYSRKPREARPAPPKRWRRRWTRRPLDTSVRPPLS